MLNFRSKLTANHILTSPHPLYASLLLGGFLCFYVYRRLVLDHLRYPEKCSDTEDNDDIDQEKTKRLAGGESPVDLAAHRAFKIYDVKNDDDSWAEEPQRVDDRDKDTPDRWIKRHPSLIRLTGRHPLNCEAPLSTLFKKGFITPTSLHYVRNHGYSPSIKWSEHRIFIHGKVTKEIYISMDQLLALPNYSIPVTLVCCGNRRKEQNMIKQTKGFNWGAAGVSTGIWTGVRLRDVLELAGVPALEVITITNHFFLILSYGKNQNNN